MLVIGYSWSDLSFNVYQAEIRMPVAVRVEDLITVLPPSTVLGTDSVNRADRCDSASPGFSCMRLKS